MKKISIGILILLMSCGIEESIDQGDTISKRTSCRFKKKNANCGESYYLPDNPNYSPGKPMASNCEEQVQEDFKNSSKDELTYNSICYDSRENDRIYNKIHPRLQKYWGVSYGARLMRARDVYDELNAFAFGDSFVAIGKAYLEELSEKKDADILITGTFAHEAAHILQYKHMTGSNYNYYDTKDPRYLELQADFLGGVFIADNQDEGYDKSFSEALPFIYDSFNVGDCYYSSPDHHGTPTQRRAAAIFGWMIGDYLKQNKKNETAVEKMKRFKNNYTKVLNGDWGQNLKTLEEENRFISTEQADILNRILNDEISREELLNYFE